MKNTASSAGKVVDCRRHIGSSWRSQRVSSPGEGTTVALLAGAMFLSTAASTLLRWLSGYLSVASVDHDRNTYTLVASLLLPIVLVYMYAAMSRRWSRAAI